MTLKTKKILIIKMKSCIVHMNNAMNSASRSWKTVQKTLFLFSSYFSILKVQVCVYAPQSFNYCSLFLSIYYT